MLCSISRRMRIYWVDLGNGNVRSYRALGSASGSGASCEHVTYRVRERRSTDLAAHAERTFRPSSGPHCLNPFVKQRRQRRRGPIRCSSSSHPLSATRVATCRAWLCRGWLRAAPAIRPTNEQAAATTKVKAGQSMPGQRSLSPSLSLVLATLCG